MPHTRRFPPAGYTCVVRVARICALLSSITCITYVYKCVHRRLGIYTVLWHGPVCSLTCAPWLPLKFEPSTTRMRCWTFIPVGYPLVLKLGHWHGLGKSCTNVQLYCSRLGKGVGRRSLFAYVSYLFNSLTPGINYDRENAK